MRRLFRFSNNKILQLVSVACLITSIVTGCVTIVLFYLITQQYQVEAISLLFDRISYIGIAAVTVFCVLAIYENT